MHNLLAKKCKNYSNVEPEIHGANSTDKVNTGSAASSSAP